MKTHRKPIIKALALEPVCPSLKIPRTRCTKPVTSSNEYVGYLLSSLCKARQEGMALVSLCQYAHAHGRRERICRLDTTERAYPYLGYRRIRQRRLYRLSVVYLLRQGYNLHPAKVIPAMPLARTICTPTVMWSQVPRLSPVHMAPKRWEPA